MMADGKKAGAKKATKSVKIGDDVELKVKVKKAKKGGKAKGGKAKSSAKSGDRGALEALAKLAESPLVTELIAAGATAAVAAIASAKKKGGGKAAAKAAASAIGARLMSEFSSMRQNARDADEG